ncbi:MAG: LPS-assembly protein LptD [Bacteroidetes bacterium]|nr:LPS-assembly protein LptD [Bacteroidota bacterium]
MLIKFLQKVFVFVSFFCVFSQNYAQNVDSISSTNREKQDSIKFKKNKPQTIDAIIDYSADDSIIFSKLANKLYLYKNAHITYKNIDLKADYIELDLKKNEVFAKGLLDSLNKTIGKPIFKQGSEEFESEKIIYNFKTKKGLIKGVFSKQSGGYLHSETTKKLPNNSVCIKNGKYTSCDLEHPHFYIALTKAKVIPNNKIISGPAYLVIEDIPLYFPCIPFGFFPNTKSRKSGVLIPTYGEEKRRGFYLRNGGWYFGISDHFDLSIKGDVFSKGTWQANVRSRYKKRYKFSGNVDVSYSDLVVGEKGLSDYFKEKQYKVLWSHSQDPKANPNSNFSANVNFSSTSYDKYSSNNPAAHLNNRKESSIHYDKTFAGTPFNFSATFQHYQNSLDSVVDLTLPEITFNMKRIFPFKMKNNIGKAKWFEKIGISYSSNLKNTVSVKEKSLFSHKTLDKLEYGVVHKIPLSTSFKVLKYFTASPSINYTERWYFTYLNKYINEADTTLATDTLNGFNRVFDYSYNASLNTQIYGMYQFKKSFIKAIRHRITPSVSLSYRPDFSTAKWGYYKTNPLDTTKKYSVYDNGIYPAPGRGKSGLVNFNVGNNIEMKIKSKKDTITGTKKIILIENLSFSTSYNILADSLNWSKIRISGRTKLFKRLDINYSANLDPYILKSDSTGKMTNVNTFEWTKNHRIARFMNSNWRFGFNLDLSPKMFNKEKENTNQNNPDKFNPDPNSDKSIMFNNDDYNSYDYFKIPWSLNLMYTLSYNNTYFYIDNKARVDSTANQIIQTLSLNGSFSLTDKWKIGFRSGYDFVNKDFSYTSINITRDLHCWIMRFNWIPFGARQSYNFEIGVKSTILQDLKFRKQQSWFDY